MLQSEVFPYYRKCVAELTKAYHYMQSLFPDADIYTKELCSLRAYVDTVQEGMIKDWGIGYCDVEDLSVFGGMGKELGLITKDNNFILANRFIVRVEGVSGDLVALIGYYPDKRKYITTPSPFFSKDCMFFNFKRAYELSMKEYGGLVFLVEGIFDCLSLDAIGLPCISTMGDTVSKVKKEILKVFKKVIAIPDDDAAGRRALNRRGKISWNVPDNTTFIKFIGGTFSVNGTELHCKDMDNFVSWYEKDDVREILLSYRDSREDIEELRLF